MAKSDYQTLALSYAKQYLARLLDFDTYVEEKVHTKLDTLVESKVRQIVSSHQGLNAQLYAAAAEDALPPTKSDNTDNESNHINL